MVEKETGGSESGADDQDHLQNRRKLRPRGPKKANAGQDGHEETDSAGDKEATLQGTAEDRLLMTARGRRYAQPKGWDCRSPRTSPSFHRQRRHRPYRQLSCYSAEPPRNGRSRMGTATSTPRASAPCSRSAALSAFTRSRNRGRSPPRKALRALRCFPSAVRGPVDRSHGRQRRIAFACCAHRVDVHPFDISLQ